MINDDECLNHAVRKVWIVSAGSYSDWRILGIFSTIELAIEAKVREGTENDIEEHSVDLMPEKPDGEYKWRFYFDENGNVLEWQTGCDFAGRRTATKCRDGSINVFAHGESFEDALKSATDTRRMLLAMDPQPKAFDMIEFD